MKLAREGLQVKEVDVPLDGSLFEEFLENSYAKV